MELCDEPKQQYFQIVARAREHSLRFLKPDTAIARCRLYPVWPIPMGDDSISYHDRLLNAYEGELIGEIFFVALAEAASAADEKRKLQYMAGLEIKTAALLAPLIERHGLTPRPRPELVAEGLRDASKYSGGTWQQLNARFAADFLPYVEAFIETEKLAPSADRRVMELVTAHEIALVDFAKDEAAGAVDSKRHLLKYVRSLDEYTAAI